MTTADDCRDLLHSAGWSMGDASFIGARGQAWVVTGTNGEYILEATGDTSTEAWQHAVEQARSLGMLWDS